MEHLDCPEPLEHRTFHGPRSRWVSDFCWKCGYEVTHVERVVNGEDTVTSDEVIAVHEAMESGKPWKELSE